ncbi:MAG: UvrD-helicase domain-containing protein, partial [Actinomycetota bacterium]
SYEYERPFDADVADATHRQYRPDFYYPDIDAWHEHWALGRDGRPPADFTGYEDSMRWKRQLHADHGTDLIETTFAETVLGDGGFAGLEKALTERGIELDWNPDRETDKTPVSNDQMVRLLRTFLSHVKSSQATRSSLRELLGGSRGALAGARTELFLSVFWPVFDAWNDELRAGGLVDFDDMLGLAADEIAQGFDPGYDLVLLDEFQDSSRARARIVEQLVSRPGRYLMTVGDDWQSINRFAGADISVMTDFHDRFGPGPQLALTSTFRCSQVICDAASEFISKNPRQFEKEMRAVDRAERDRPLEITFAKEPRSAVNAFLQRVSKDAGENGATVYVLGRYWFERDDAMPPRAPRNVRVEFLTVHSSKGTEADYVVVPGMNSGTHGFPSTIADDPVLDLVMAAPDTYEHAEERRLLYVALTRARLGAHLIAAPSRPSAFVSELQDLGQPEATDPLVVQVDSRGKPITPDEQVQPCPQCGTGTLTRCNPGTARTCPFGEPAFP